MSTGIRQYPRLERCEGRVGLLSKPELMIHTRLQFAARASLIVVLCLVAAACGSDSPSSPTQSSVKVSAVSPTSGSTTGGNSVTITGTGFSSDATVTIGGVVATGVVVSGTTSINAVTGVRMTAGAAEVTVTSGGKMSTLSNAFTFVAPSGANRPPVISAFRSVGSRNNQPSGFADIDETVQVLATVTDSETSNASLTYEWTGPGSLAPSGPTLTWKIPNAIAGGTPSTVTIGLKVTETFTEGGVVHMQSTSGTFPLRVHDSQKEVTDAGQDFLLLFSDSKYTTDQVLHNFSTTCDSGRGRSAEAVDVDRNRREGTQDAAAARITPRPPATFSFKGNCVLPDGRVQRNIDACISYNAHWEYRLKSNGSKDITDGVDYVSAVLENDRWLLCHSDFIGSSRNTLTGEIRSLAW